MPMTAEHQDHDIGPVAVFTSDIEGWLGPSFEAKVSTKSAPEATAQQQAPGREHEVRVPMMINTKAIKADDELLIYRAPKRKAERKVEKVKVAKFMKDREPK